MASDAGIYGLANRPTTEALDPFEIARRRLSIQNALAAQQIQQQQIQTGAIGLENAQRDQAAEAAFRAQFMTPAAPGVPAVPNALAPAAMLPAGPGPGSAAWSPAAASVLPAPGGMPVNGAPGADSGPGGMLASPAPGAAPGATKTPAGVTLGDIPDSALYASFGSKAPGIIKARDEAAAAVATRQQKLGEVREQDQKFWACSPADGNTATMTRE
jgi:PAB1-binding protein PBP1